MHWRYTLRAGILIAALFVLGRAGLLFATVSGFSTLVWPAFGLAVAALMLGGTAYALPVLIGEFLAFLSNGSPPLLSLGAAAGDTVGALFVMWAMRRVAPTLKPGRFSVSDVVAYLSVAAVAGPVVAAIIGVATILAGQLVHAYAIVEILVHWFLSESLGALSMGTLVLSWSARFEPGRVRWPRVLEALLLAMSGVGASALVLASPQISMAYPVVVLVLFPVAIWSSVRQVQRATTSILFVIGIGTVILIANQEYSRAVYTAQTPLLLFTTTLIAVYGAALFLTAEINSRRDAEQEIRNQAVLLENINDAVISFTPDFTILTWNKAAETIYGWKSEKIVGQNGLKLMSTLTPEQLQKNMEILLKEGTIAGETFHRRRDGALVPIATSTTVIKDENGLVRCLVSVNRDLSERVTAREKDRYQAYLLENVAEAVIATGADLRIRHWNKAAETLMGIPTEEAMDQVFKTVIRSRLTGQDADTLEAGINAAMDDGGWKGEIGVNRADDNSRIPVSLSLTFVIGADRKSSNLIAVFTDISERVQAQKALEDLNLSLEGRISTRTAQLASANAQLLELDRVKSQFIADVSHEMRTPLATMKTAIHLLGVDQPEKRDRHLELLHSETNRLTRFVESVLDASRVDLQIHDIYIEPVSIQRILNELCNQTNSKNSSQNADITLDAPDDVPLVAGDANMLRRMFASVLDNALKYAPESSIKVTAAYDRPADVVRVQIADTGPGIAPDHLPRVFDRFYRGDHAQSNIPGSGLGLAIARIIVDAHQGEIKVESEVGKGTTVTILLPAVRL